MADYYVNLEKSEYGLGTDSTPYGADQFFALSYMYVTPGDVFHIKGQLDTSRNVYLGSPFITDMTLTSWLPEINGPWRLRAQDCSNFLLYRCYLEGAIISVENNTIFTSVTPAIIRNSVLRIYPVLPQFPIYQNLNIEGSILLTEDFIIAGCGAVFRAKDTLFDYNNYSGPPSGEYTKCAFRGDFAPGTVTDCAKDWTTTLPAWNASKESWRIDRFLGGLDSSVKNGTAPYTNYENDLWGNPRSRIGSGFMPGSSNYYDTTSASDGSSVISHAYPEYLVETIQNKGADTYFDTTSEISRAVVFYTHQDGRQNKRVVHTAPNYTASVSWPSGARDGTWQKTVVKVYDTNNAVAVLSRSDMDSSHDLIHSGGAMTLNVA
jgi:hypothetical protein